ncbi:MAG TPA: hypothetical protein VNK92_00775 [Vicinamibacterales bacterium]|nr:hypothetical protein [Vicinamibacterales bacterium]
MACRRSRRRGLRVAILWLPLLLFPIGAAGQDPASSFRELSARITLNDTVQVTQADGRRVKGKVLDLGVTSLTLLVSQRDVTEKQVFFEDSTRAIVLADSIRNGALIGLGVAVGVTLLSGSLRVCGSDDRRFVATCMLAILGGGAGVGLAVGAGVDALTNRVVYVSPQQAAWQVYPSWELAGGYALLRDTDRRQTFPASGFVSAGWQVTDRLAIMAELSGHRTTFVRPRFHSDGVIRLGEIHYNALAYLVGVRYVHHRPAVTPFAQVLAGPAEESFSQFFAGDAHGIHPVVQVGGGIDIRLGGPVSMRLAGEYRRVFDAALVDAGVGDRSLDQLRLSSGLAARFGARSSRGRE